MFLFKCKEGASLAGVLAQAGRPEPYTTKFGVSGVRPGRR